MNTGQANKLWLALRRGDTISELTAPQGHPIGYGVRDGSIVPVAHRTAEPLLEAWYTVGLLVTYVDKGVTCWEMPIAIRDLVGQVEELN